MLGGNWVDLLIIIVLIIYVWEGYNRGFLLLVGEMGSFILAFLVALKLYPIASGILMSNFSLSLEMSKAVGFVISAIGVEIILGIGIGQIYRMIPREWFTWRWNRIIGIIPATIDGLLLVGIFATTIIGLPISPVLKQEVLGSRIGGVMVERMRGTERYLDDVFGGAIKQTLSFLTVTTGSTETVNLHFKLTEMTTDTKSETEMLTLLNKERISRGIAPLTLNAEVSEAARRHSVDMFKRGYFSHIDPDGNGPVQRIEKSGMFFEIIGENIAYAPTVGIAHEGLMGSPGHKANILSPDYRGIGIGVVDGGVYGKMFTQDFVN